VPAGFAPGEGAPAPVGVGSVGLVPAGWDRTAGPGPDVEALPAWEPEPAGRPVMVRRPVGARVVRPAGAGVRLTRRGRLVAVAAILILAGLGLIGAAGRVGALHGSPVPASAPGQVVVQPGETLWSIAARVAPQRDPRTVVDRIRRLNDLPDTEIRPGQTLLLRTG
jgi:hypothetical protein